MSKPLHQPGRRHLSARLQRFFLMLLTCFLSFFADSCGLHAECKPKEMDNNEETGSPYREAEGSGKYTHPYGRAPTSQLPPEERRKAPTMRAAGTEMQRGGFFQSTRSATRLWRVSLFTTGDRVSTLQKGDAGCDRARREGHRPPVSRQR